MHSYSSPHSNWTVLWVVWKTLFVKLHTETFLSAKFDYDMSTFFVLKPIQNLLLFQSQLECIHSYSSPHFIWTKPWLDWKALLVELTSDTFLSSIFDKDKSTFFVFKPDQNFFWFRNLLGCINCCSSPHYIWTHPWLDWNTLFLKLHTDTFWAQKLTTTWVLFS